MTTRNIFSSALAALMMIVGLLPGTSATPVQAKSEALANVETYDSSIGKLEFHNGYEKGVPTEASREKLMEAYDLSNATTAYAWALPIVAMQRMAHRKNKQRFPHLR